MIMIMKNFGSSSKSVFYVGLGVAALSGAVVGYYVWKYIEDEDDGNRRNGGLLASSTVLEMKIPSEHAGVVIGRHGSNIKEIQQRTNTRITFQDELTGCKERTLLIRGKPDDAQLAEILIHQTILNQPRLETMEIKIPEGSTGFLIGRNGDTIRAIQMQSKCKINVDRSSRSSDGMKIVTLKGTDDQISFARTLIVQRIAEDKNLRQRIRNTSETRPPRITYKQPLFLTSDWVETSPPPPSSKKTIESLAPMNTDHVMEIFVSSIVDPDLFYVQKVGPQSIKLDKLVQEMTSYYEEKSNRDLHTLEVEVGDIVASKFGCDDNWYRSRVIKMTDNDYNPEMSEIEVEFVDFGDCEKKTRKQLNDAEILDLKTDFLKLNFQAIPCSLARVTPKNKEEGWTEESCLDFQKLTHCAQWKIILAKVVEYDTSTSDEIRPSLELFDTEDDTDINVGQEMINLEHALPCVDF